MTYHDIVDDKINLMSVQEAQTAHSVRKMLLPVSEQLDALSLASGSVYTKTVVWHWRHVRRQDIWLSEYRMKRRLENGQPTILHSQSAQKSIECFYDAMKTWREAKKTSPKLRAPYKLKRYYKIVWKSSAIRVKGGNLVLSNARKQEPVVIAGWTHELPTQVEIGWTGSQYELRATYKSEVKSTENAGVASCDLGEVHPAVVGTQDYHLILNGGELRSKRRYREKLKAELSAKIDRKKKGSKRRRRLVASKQKKLKRLDNQIRDIAHKLTSAAINTLHERGVGTLAIGDVRDIRVDNDKGKVQNQRLHQAPLGRIRNYLTYKAARLGWTVELVNEAWTSQDCPQCGARNKPAGRVYECASCGLVAHRDVVGQVNILDKYLGNDKGCRVVGAMASPSGLRYVPQLQCRSPKSARIPGL